MADGVPQLCFSPIDPPQFVVDAASVAQNQALTCPANGQQFMATHPPLNYFESIEGGDFFSNKINYTYMKCQDRPGNTSDCPTPAGQPGACTFVAYPDKGACYNGNLLFDPENASFCMKTGWDTQSKHDCCLGKLVGSTTTYDRGDGTTPTISAPQVLCAPTWCQVDAFGDCEDVFQEYCGTQSISTPQGWVHTFMGDPASNVCAAWYHEAIMGQAPFSRWPVIDAIVTNYCTNNPQDTVSCGCFLQTGGANGGNVCDGVECFLYTSVSKPTPTDNGLRKVRNVDAVTSNPLNFSDYACLVPQCNITGGGLLTSDVWGMQYSGRCPDICLQVLADEGVVMKGDTVTGGIYADMNNKQCGGALASVTLDAPLLMAPMPQVSLMWPHYTDCSLSDASCCPAGGCTQTVPIDFALGNQSADMTYTITFDPPLPPAITVQNTPTLAGTLSLNGLPRAQLQLNVAAADAKPGVYTSTVTIQDVRPEFATCRANTVVNLTVYDTSAPPPPQGPTGPNPGAGPAIVFKDEVPFWMLCALGAALFVALVLAIRHLVIHGTHKRIRLVLANPDLALPASAPELTPVAPVVPVTTATSSS